MIEVILDDRLGKKVRVKCNEDDTIGDLKKLAAAQLGTRPEKLKIQKWYTGKQENEGSQRMRRHDTTCHQEIDTVRPYSLVVQFFECNPLPY